MSKEKFSCFFIEEQKLKNFILIFLFIVIVIWINVGLKLGLFCLIFTLKDLILIMLILIFLFYSINKTIESFVIIVSLTRIVDYVVKNNLLNTKKNKI